MTGLSEEFILGSAAYSVQQADMAITADWLSSHPLKNLNQEKRSMRGPWEPLNNVFRQDTSGKARPALKRLSHVHESHILQQTLLCIVLLCQ